VLNARLAVEDGISPSGDRQLPAIETNWVEAEVLAGVDFLTL
jgi:hypothetical protein